MLQHLTIEASRAAYTVRLAGSREELTQAQALRYRVFYGEMQASADASVIAEGRDSDRFDAFCDHLIVLYQQDDASEVVGTYRLLRQEVAEANGGFYSQSEFDIGPLLARKPELRFLELGRSCVLAAHRTKPVIDLLWQGIWNYVRAHRMDVMFGCASLEGADAKQHATTLAYLAQHHAPPPEWHVAALPARRAAVPPASPPQDLKQVMRELPPLVKGYLRLGCHIGEGAVEDHQFGTTDVLIILPVSNINPRYFERFGQPVSG